MSQKTISQVKQLLKAVASRDDPVYQRFLNDPRKGVQALVRATSKRIDQLAMATTAFHRRFKYEQQFWRQGIQTVAGVDEVGRGPLAGPVVACAVILPQDFDLVAVNDSKQLTPSIRKALAPQIKREAIAVGMGVVDNRVIDQINIYEATRVAMKQAVQELAPMPEEIIVDAMNIDVPIHQTRLIKGDAKSISVSAASILAKVYRDHLMDDFALKYPEYDFTHNAGYGTAKHLAALKKYGATPIHRKTFAPVKNYCR
ncbi:ribonuclease HII [Lentilactobacillus parafarraginis]|jgi:ribonuclease HII|uniref:Ribonuclease HII n=2 Tax=Lentilactobacillus parafarraginis TaxID=390842 RepID=A0A0R1YMU0_9LACO|nr:ribonuclease HII [Lentilactobacillus parafarraginis]KRM43800.1 ribonuclease HII [Lentilactobacillus parafarraginis DSM 18390 = JCM 14109]TLQ21060.1 ribonuclease HII [Lentilactobacillus parafarraginis]